MADHLVSLDEGFTEVSVSQPSKRVPCEVYSRIVGYLRPVRAWNQGKQREFADRKVYAVLKEPSPPEAES